MEDRTIEWCFFDLGSTLVDETDAWRHRLFDTAEQSNSLVNAEDLIEKITVIARTSCRPYQELLSRFEMTATPWHPEDEILFPQTKSILAYLHEKYSIGIIANQITGTRQRLSEMGIAPYIDLLVSSDEAGMSKPDPEIFIGALKKAGTSADRVVMIGDRIDNDILPAKALGFKTIWIRQGLGGLYRIQNDSETPDHVIETLDELYNIL